MPATWPASGLTWCFLPCLSTSMRGWGNVLLKGSLLTGARIHPVQLIFGLNCFNCSMSDQHVSTWRHHRALIVRSAATMLPPKPLSVRCASVRFASVTIIYINLHKIKAKLITSDSTALDSIRSNQSSWYARLDHDTLTRIPPHKALAWIPLSRCTRLDLLLEWCASRIPL